MKEVPPFGGDTVFADMYLAYEMLSENMQGMLEGLVAVNDEAVPYVGSYKSTLLRRLPARKALGNRYISGGEAQIALFKQRLHLSHQGTASAVKRRASGYAVPPHCGDS